MKAVLALLRRHAELRNLRRRVKNQRHELHVIQNEYNSLWRSFCTVMDECRALQKSTKEPIE